VIPDIVEKAKTLKVNGGTEKGADLGPVISKQAKTRIEGLIEQGVKEGAKLELDGRNPKVPGYPKGNFIARR
jgi:malonate-semialdehyde dehydrogenase (acetylating)/methylmalonate-semialdehyde dehydrogenase